MNTSVNNILDGLKTNAALQEFKQNNMENKTPFDIIQSTENAPFTLNKLSEDFLSVESTFNSTIKKLIDEKTEIEMAYKNAISYTKGQHEQQIHNKETSLTNGSYFPAILQEFSAKWQNEKVIYTILKWASVLVGVYVLFTVQWFAGILIGGIGFWVFGALVNKIEGKINALSSYLKTTVFSPDIQIALHKVSNNLNIALNKARIEFEEENEELMKSLKREYDQKEADERRLRDKRLENFEQKKQSELSQLRDKTNNDILNTTKILNNLVELLNQLPESFNSNSIDWKSDNIFKGKESVATNFRVGEDLLQISIEGTDYSIKVPRCFPFLNKSNIAFNCNNQNETKEAIRITHNLIARTLLSLPASKTKITFIDPLELGGNAAPFTPLLREIYGGMVFTQPNDIENQLAILTRAIENVIQKYLQDKFKDIAEYNFKTKEVPEPYRLLVVYNFPHGFNDTTASKLLNIIKSGPKAGVHTILVNDKNAKLPYGMEWSVFISQNIQVIKLDNSNFFDIITDPTEDKQQVQLTVHEPKAIIGNIYDGVVKSVTAFGAFVEFLSGKEGLLHISEISNDRLKSLDGIVNVGDRIRVKLLDVDSRTGKFKLSIKAIQDNENLTELKTENKNSPNTPNLTVVSPINVELKRVFKFDKNLPYSEIVNYINKELPNTNSIKVLFKLPPQSEWWQNKAHKRFSVPIGRHAVEEQSFTLNNDDDNQALLIGKPGSGKSNLLHTIITNSLWKYSPDQLEIYLIDFKGGVEFAIYADKKIPHIKTIAIESEREFGLSVLDGVERELLRREMEFSKTGVQNIEQYHEKFPDVKMPRVLLIVDEFQEFYAEDDNIKQAVDDKFDRIVRKGRAFGVNTLFSSQTLSGNSIKKSTKELIDIRIALMCSDLDSSQILDDRNPAARDLTRPGEGIYNSENGKVEGNRRFQAFFMETADLINTIESVVAFANTNGNAYKNFKQIIFRGSEKARLQRPEGHPLENIKASLNPKSLRLWLGEPVAIAEDVTAIIRKQGGSNLLVAGYDESIGLRVMSSSIISIAVQQQPNTCKFYSFNFYNVDSEFVNVPDELFKSIEQECVAVNGRQAKDSLQSIKEEIEKRLLGNSANNPNMFLTFFSLQRGRAFRKDGYSMSDEGNILAFILKEGADVGVYSLVQVDTMDNFSKNLDDNLLKEFSQRIASQMNPDNSVKLIGNQKAAKLGSNRALYYDDNENTMIKFKPYELPAFTWVAQLQKPQSTLS